MKREAGSTNPNPSLPPATSARGSRCSHLFPSGRRCRLLAAPPAPGSQGAPPGENSVGAPPLCHRHRPKEDPAAELVRNLREFRSVSDLTVFLSRLIFALSRDQISTRRASVLSYVAVSLMHGFRTLQQEHLSEMGESRFDPLPWTWKVPRPHRPDFVNIDDARAYFAQVYADEMRHKAKESLDQSGLKSHFYPYLFGERKIAPPPEDKPMTEAEAIASHNRLRT